MVKRVFSRQQVLFAKSLRHQQSDAELTLWNHLRNLQLDGIKFRRQHPIGKYIVDFVSLDRKLIIEIDGGQHNLPQEKERDDERTIWLESEGYGVLRFWNNDVLTNMEGVYFTIQDALKR